MDFIQKQHEILIEKTDFIQKQPEILMIYTDLQRFAQIHTNFQT